MVLQLCGLSSSVAGNFVVGAVQCSARDRKLMISYCNAMLEIELRNYNPVALVSFGVSR